MAEPDLVTVHVLCVLQLAARRLGYSIRVHGASAELRELIVLVGLDELLLDGPDAEREQDEQAELEVRVDPVDPGTV